MASVKKGVDVKNVRWEVRKSCELKTIELILNNATDELKPNVFQTSSWLDALNNGEGLDFYVCWYNNEQLLGYFIGFDTKKFTVEGLHIPVFTHTFAPIISSSLNVKSTNAVINGLLELLASKKVVDFKFPANHFNFLPYFWNGFQCQPLITYVIEGDYTDYLAALNKNKKREYKKLMTLVDSGEIEIRYDIPKDDWLRLFLETSERGGFKANIGALTSLFEEKESYPHRLISLYSKQHGYISVGLFPYDRQRVYNVINASLRFEDSVLKTTNLLLLMEAIKFTLDSGRKFDFEGSMLPGVSSFYELMGGVQVPIYRLTKSKSFVFSLLRAFKQMKDDRK